MEAAQRSPGRQSFFDRPLAIALPIDRELALYIVLVAIGAILRLWDLGSRMLHHDESLHAVYSYLFYIGRGYEHDPMLHGPFQFHWYAFWQFLLGATDATVRVGNSVLGIALISLPYFFRRYMGRNPALVAAALIAFSPTLLYFSRFAREDMPTLWWSALVVLFVVKYLHKQEPRWMYLTAGALALAFSTKENAYILSAMVLSFLAFLEWSRTHRQWYWYALMLSPLPIWFLISLPRGPIDIGLFIIDLWPKDSESTQLAILSILPVCVLSAVVVVRTIYRVFFKRENLSPPAALLFVGGLLITPLFTASITALEQFSQLFPSKEREQPVLFGLFFIVLVVTLLAGTRWKVRQWLLSALVFWGVFFVLHTVFFSDPNGAITGSVGALTYWIDQQAVARGSQPWFYYLLLLPLYEFVAVLFGIGGMIYIAIKRNNLFAMFLAYWIAINMALYGYASEKMPWLAIHMSLPIVLAAGYAIGRLLDNVGWRNVVRLGAIQYTVALALVLVMFFTVLGQGFPSNLRLDEAGVALRVFFLVAYLSIFIGLVYCVYRFGARLGWSNSLRLAAVGGLALMMPFSIRTAFEASFRNGDVPVEMLVYTQTSPDVGIVMDEIERLAFRTGEGKESFRVAYDAGVSWPFEWYLREYKNKNYFAWDTPAADAKVVLVGFDRNHDEDVEQILGASFVGQRFRLRWWFPEDYREFTIENIVQGLADPDVRNKLWRYFLYRETVNPLGSTDFMVFVRRDLATGAWAATQVTAPSASIIGSGLRGTQPGEFNEPKNLAIGPDDSIYVADTSNHRIQKLNAAGEVLEVWGSEGEAPGQFNEPWGIAVDPDGFVYVADTWNHRVQQFDLDGNFVAIIGPERVAVGSGPREFYGPRAVAVDSLGNIYVTDTGNHRIQVFGSHGEFIAQFGEKGSAEGFFHEPVGIAIDTQGNLLIADTWNHRVQKLRVTGEYLASWPISGWSGQSVLNKPYIAVDSANNFYVTDPENHRVAKYGPDGQLQTAWGSPGTDATSIRFPTGIAIDGQGFILVADSRNNRIVRHPPIE